MKNKIALILLSTTLFIFIPEANAQKLGDIWKKAKKEVSKAKEILNKKNENQKKEKPNQTGNDEGNVENTLKLNPNDFINFNAPNKDFKLISFQKHKGLPRIGVLNSYGSYTKKYNLKNATIGKLDLDQVKYFQMVRAKYYFNSFEKIDKDILYDGRHKPDDPDAAYKTAQNNVQNYIQNLTYSLVSEKGMDKYFTNPNDGYGGKGKAKTWGGHSSDEFRKIEIYRDFSKNNLDLLVNWTSTFFDNNQSEFYFVEALEVGTYNFEKESYLIGRGSSISHKISSQSSQYKGNIRDPFGNYVGQNEFEHNPSNNAFFDYGLLLKISPDKAKSLKEELLDYSNYSPSTNRHVVFMVRKVKMQTVKKRRTLKSQSKPQETQEQEFSYSFSEPFAEIYSDEGLTNKIGTIKLFNTDAEQKLASESKVSSSAKTVQTPLPQKTNTSNTSSTNTNQTTPVVKTSSSNRISDEGIERYKNNYIKMYENALRYNYVEQAPVFPGCEESSESELKSCFSKKFYEHFKTNFYYPEGIMEGTERKRFGVSFIVNTFGEVVGIKNNISIFSGEKDRAINAMAVDVISKLPKFKPAMNRGKKVNVVSSFPITLSI